MTEEEKPLTKKQQAAVDHFRRKITFSPEYDEEQRRKAAVRDESITLNAKIGDPVPGGDVYAGLSPDTGERMYARAKDEETLFSFNAAAKRAKDLSQKTGKTYRVPTIRELKVLFNNHAAIGNFDTDSQWYGSSSSADFGADYARGFLFPDGRLGSLHRNRRTLVRLVRS